jgi:RHS repeat-associated protein
MVGTTIKTATTYEPYGKLLAQTGSSGTTYGFTGEQYDAATGLVYLRARYYNPSLKLFMSRDPFPGIPTMPASQHGYSYSHNNPVNLTDPTGESPVPAIIVVGGAVIVVVVLYIAIDTIFDAAPAMSELAGSFWDWCTTTFAPPRPQAQPQTVPQTKTETVVVPVPEPQTHPTPRPTLPPPGPDAPTPTPENNSWVYFVHGTSTATWVGNYETPRALGGGDFGRGFYVFEDTNWGRNSARSWAIIKSDSGGTPIVLRYKMKRETYDSLYTYQVPDYELTSFIRQYSRQGLTGYDLVIGGVGMRANIGLPGDRVRNFGFPDQYKFEGDAVGYLIFDGVVAK